LADFQPVENDTLQQQAFQRWNKLPAIIQTEMDNLKMGIAEGYTMPKEIVAIVIEQLQKFQDSCVIKCLLQSNLMAKGYASSICLSDSVCFNKLP
jgi:uncharacterized protein (DUF885 family)